MNKETTKINASKRAVLRVILSRSLYEFVKYFWDTVESAPYLDSWLLEYLCEMFQWAVKDYIPDQFKVDWLPDKEWDKLPGKCPVRDDYELLPNGNRKYKRNHNINMPPRHAKSLIWNVFGPAWICSICANSIASVSHNEDLSIEMNEKRKMIFESKKWQDIFGKHMKKSRAENIELTDHSKLFSVNPDAFTGKGCNMVIVDDIVSTGKVKKDAKTLEGAKTFFSATLPNRMNQPLKDVIINVMQRQSPNDITAFIFNNDMGKVYTSTVIRAIAEEEEDIKFACSGKVVHRNVGDPLWINRFGDYSHLRIQMGEKEFQTQYQQKPVTNDMVIITEDMLHLQESFDPIGYDLVYSSYDLPIKDTEQSDNAGVVLGFLKDGTLYITSALEDKMAYIKSKAYIKEMSNRYKGIIQIVENKANGAAIVQDLQQDIPVIPFNPGTKSKTERLEIAAQYVASGHVVICNTYLSCIQHLIERITEFPFVNHDDLVDAFSQLVLYVFSDMQYSVYGNNITKENIISLDDFNPKEVAYDYGIFKDGNLYYVLQVAIDYEKDTFIATREWVVNSLDEVVEKCSNARLVYDCNDNNEIYNLLVGKLAINPNIYSKRATINQMSIGLLKRRVKIANTCPMTRNALNNFRWVKSSKDKGKEEFDGNDGIASCLRIVIASVRGEKTTWM